MTEAPNLEVSSFVAEIIPGTIGHEALKDMLYVEVSRFGHDQGKKPSPRYEARLGQIQTRRKVPAYEEAYDRISAFYQNLVNLEHDSKTGYKNATKKVMEEAIKFGLIPPESRALIAE